MWRFFTKCLQFVPNVVDQIVAYNTMLHVEGLEVVKCAKHCWDVPARLFVGTVASLVAGTQTVRCDYGELEHPWNCRAKEVWEMVWAPGAGETSDIAWMNQGLQFVWSWGSDPIRIPCHFRKFHGVSIYIYLLLYLIYSCHQQSSFQKIKAPQ